MYYPDDIDEEEDIMNLMDEGEIERAVIDPDQLGANPEDALIELIDLKYGYQEND